MILYLLLIVAGNDLDLVWRCDPPLLVYTSWDLPDDLMNPQVSVGPRRHTCVHHVLAAPGNARNESLRGGNTVSCVGKGMSAPVSRSTFSACPLQEQRKNEPINWRSIFQVYWRKLLGTCSTWFLLDSVLYANGYVTVPLYTTTTAVSPTCQLLTVPHLHVFPQPLHGHAPGNGGSQRQRR